jgi:AcrR family transcriptional regulator
MESHPLSAIKVTQICELADVNRSTFYSYYDDIFELLDEMENEIIEKIPTQEKLGRTTVKVVAERFTVFFDYVKENKKTFSILLNENSRGFANKMMTFVVEHFSPNGMSEADPELRYGYIFAMNGVIGIMKEWIKEDFPFTPAKFAELAIKMSVRSNT